MSKIELDASDETPAEHKGDGPGAPANAGAAPANQASLNAGEGADNDAGKDVSEDAGKGAGNDVAKDASEDAGKDATGDAGKDASEAAAKGTRNDAEKEAGKGRTESAAKDATQDAAPAAAKDTPADHAKGARDAGTPLAELLRPANLDEVVGQDALLGADGRLRRMIEAGELASIIFWGPPGTGKTTIARLLAKACGMEFEPVSAVFDGVAELRKVFARAQERATGGQRTLLFVDEVHRFNKAQQDGLLPRVEDGTVTLVGATTENPSFALNAALLSRAQVMVLERLSVDALERILVRVEARSGAPLPIDNEARAALKAMADGDGRYLLNMAAQLVSRAPGGAGQDADQDTGETSRRIGARELAGIVAGRAPVFDRAGEQHYNLMSALHKTLRGSDADAALYWLARMFAGGEDPHYILRRLTRFASEDIGLAEPEALVRSLSAWQAYERLGSPEGELAIAGLVIYLATAPKSNASYVALKTAVKAAQSTGSLMPPAHILNAPTGLMKDLGYGRDYAYDHDDPDGFSGQDGFPDEMERVRFYRPVERGFERDIAKRLAYWDRLREKKSRSKQQ